MSLTQDKKGGLELSTLAEIILILIAAGLILYVFTYAASRAEEKTSEKLCRGLNAIRLGTKVSKGPLTFSYLPAPRACKTIDKKDLPGKDYKDHPSGLKEGAKAELRDMIAKCWYMWLEGKHPNIFDTSTTSPQNKCFICYAFSLQDEVSITIPEFIASLDAPYEAADSSHRCAAGGQGGHCMASCSQSLNLIEVDSVVDRDPAKCPDNQPICKRCPEPLKCCISKNINDGCVNKGGICLSVPKDGYKLYNKWNCGTGNCYVKDENFISYLDYVQGTKGATGGAGFIVYDDKLKNANGLTNKKKYGVTLISPGNSWGADTWAWGAATVIIPPLAVAAQKYGGWIVNLIPISPSAKIGAVVIGELYTIEMLKKSGRLAGYNLIYISEYDTIKDMCYVEQGVDAQ
ncbi:MAG: hypothetical protein AABX33_07910 [Nanoarchaeota archaeon]